MPCSPSCGGQYKVQVERLVGQAFNELMCLKGTRMQHSAAASAATSLLKAEITQCQEIQIRNILEYWVLTL